MVEAKRDQNRVVTLMLENDSTGEPVRAKGTADGKLLALASVTGGVTGPGSSTDNAVVRWDGTGGTTVQNSVVTISDTGVIAGAIFGNTGLKVQDTNASHTLAIVPGSNITADRTLTLTTGDADRTISLTGNLTIAADFATSGANSLTLTTTGATNVTLPTTGTLATLAGSESLTNKKLGSLTSNGIVTTSGGDGTLSVTATTGSGNVVLASSPTITTPTIGSFTNATHNHTNAAGGGQLTDAALSAAVSASKGGTGQTSLTANNVILGNGTDAVQFVAPGTSGNVLTSNGTTWASTAAAGGTPRRNLNVLMDLNHISASGTNPTNTTALNGVQCSTTTSDTASLAKYRSSTVGNWDFYDKNPEFNINTEYSSGSDTGDGIMFFGDSGGNQNPTATLTTKSMFIFVDVVSGTPTISAVNANGTTNTNTTISSITLTEGNLWRVVKNSTTNIKYYCNYTLKATHTTNLPSGDQNSADFFIHGTRNDAGDTTTRTCIFGYLDILLDSPTT